MTSFQQVSSHAIPILQAAVEQYVEPQSGARHIHLATASPELVFLVAFPTVPETSDGRAHILEHLALSGSQRYPVRAPFFSMMRRSTATFMNAFTYPDRTVYPFASTSRKDFFNLLDVYLDAAFFPQLDYLNFLQEGWRHVLDGDTLGYQGVVLNEMKGAFNNPLRALHHGIASQLFRGTTYEVESGGDPLDIPQLSHQMLKDFHASHYHPSQAIFMTSGNIAAADIQQQIVAQVLARQGGGSARHLPQLAKAWTTPAATEVRVPSQQARDDEFGVQYAWLLGETADPVAYYRAHLLSVGLLGDASAPLMKTLESAGYGRPSNINGLDAGARQMAFHIGMEGLTQAQTPQARTRIWSALEQAAADGVPTSVLKAALRDLRYKQREISGAGMPYGLSRLLEALPVVMYGGDVRSALDNQAALDTLERQTDDPQFFRNLVRQLINNQSRLDTQVIPDAAYFTEREARERAVLAARQAALTGAERERVLAEMARLAAHQQQPSDTALLPRILPGDVPPQPRPLLDVPPATPQGIAFSVPSNGITYANVRFDVSSMAEAEWPWLSLFTRLAPELGVAQRDYEATSAWRQALVPAFGIALDAVHQHDGRLQIELSFSASGLREEQAAIAEVLLAAIAQPRFDEHARLAFLIDRLAQETASQAAEAGNKYAMLAATAPLSAVRRFDDAVDGVGSLAFHQSLQQQSQTAEGCAAIAATLADLHRRLLERSPTVLCAGIEDDGAALGALLRSLKLPRCWLAEAAPPQTAPPTASVANLALHAVSPINHCVIAWSAPAEHHGDAAALAVAAALLSNQVLHQSLREQGGAYGGFAGYSGAAGVFTMASYRDPRLAGTYADFAAAIDVLLEREFSREQIEEAIICVIKGLDHPATPYGEMLAAWTQQRRGATAAVRQQFRRQVLDCDAGQVRVVARRWLKNGHPSRAAFVGNVGQELSGLEVRQLIATGPQR